MYRPELSNLEVVEKFSENLLCPFFMLKPPSTFPIFSMYLIIHFIIFSGDNMITYLFLQLKMNITLHEYAVFSCFSLITRGKTIIVHFY